jgi:SRSO17 transposase
VRSTRWRPFQRVFSDGSEEKRFVREIVFHKRRRIRYYELTSDPEKLPAATTRFVMTNLEGELRHSLGNFYGLRTWIEIVFPQVTKADVRAGFGGRDNVADLDLVIGDNHTVHQQFKQLASLGEGRLC